MKALVQALAKARLKFGSITKEGCAQIRGTATYRYVTLDDIVAATAPALAAEGLIVYHDYKVIEGVLDVTAKLTDGEHELTSTVSLPLDGVKAGSNQAQAVGSLLTYGRRYSISALLCICADVDDDAQATAKPVEEPKKPVKAAIADEQKRRWLAQKFEEYGTSEGARACIIAGLDGKTGKELLAEIVSMSQ